MSWRLQHTRSSETCIFTINTNVFQELMLGGPLYDAVPYDLANTYINIAYCLQHAYDFYRIHMPAEGTKLKEPRAIPWYKLPVLRYLLGAGYRYVFYLDADAYIHQADLSIPEALPSFFANEDKLMFAPRDSAGWSLLNADTLLFGCRKGTCDPLLHLIHVWWDFPDNATYTWKLGNHGKSLCDRVVWPAEQGCLGAIYTMTSMRQHIEMGSAWTQPFHALSFVQHWTSASGD